jgi:hypothetical protein
MCGKERGPIASPAPLPVDLARLRQDVATWIEWKQTGPLNPNRIEVLERVLLLIDSRQTSNAIPSELLITLGKQARAEMDEKNAALQNRANAEFARGFGAVVAKLPATTTCAHPVPTVSVSCVCGARITATLEPVTTRATPTQEP